MIELIMLFFMSIITLTTDWGYKDFYSGAVKGKILSYLPDATIVEITNDIPKFNIFASAFTLKNCFHNFPKGTVHIVSINSEASVKTPHIIIKYQGHYFIGADNGIFSLICNNEPEVIVEVNIPQDTGYFTFPTRDLFAKVACMIAKGEDILKLGVQIDELNEKINLTPVIDNEFIRGTVIYIDSYENIYTNISEKIFKDFVKKKSFKISLPNSEHNINTLSTAYQDVSEGDTLAFFSSVGLLEIAMNQGNAAGLLGVNLNDIIRIEVE